MQVREEITHYFRDSLLSRITDIATDEGLLSGPADLENDRFINRSIIPHIVKLSDLFNRKSSLETDPELEPDLQAHYWKESSNPKNLKLAYMLQFLPTNAYRVASVFSELNRLGWTLPEGPTSWAEVGAGPGSGIIGALIAESIPGRNLQLDQVALFEKNRQLLKTAEKLIRSVLNDRNLAAKKLFLNHGVIDLKSTWFPKSAKYDVIIASYFLNEFTDSPRDVANSIRRNANKHLKKDGILVIVEPALKKYSRKLLEIRKELIQKDGLKILTPCLGHQACGALAEMDDWCHEEVLWMRPQVTRKIDRLTGLNSKSLSFSYLVISNSVADQKKILTRLPGDTLRRLVSPARERKGILEFYTCGPDGKHRMRKSAEKISADKKTLLRREKKPIPTELERGDIIHATKFKSDQNIEKTLRLETLLH